MTAKSAFRRKVANLRFLLATLTYIYVYIYLSLKMAAAPKHLGLGRLKSLYCLFMVA